MRVNSCKHSAAAGWIPAGLGATPGRLQPTSITLTSYATSRPVRRGRPRRVRLFQPGAGSEPGARGHRGSRFQARRAPCRSQVSARARGRCRRRAVVRGWLLVAAAEGEDAGLALVPGGAGRPRHLHRSEAPQLARDARDPRTDCGEPDRCGRGHAGRRAALHEAVLAEQRPLQQPHRAQVRADVHAAVVRRRGEGLGVSGRDIRDQARRVHRPDAGAAAADVLRSEGGSDRHEQESRRRQRHPASERQQPLLECRHGGSERLCREVRPQLAADQARRQAGGGGLSRRRDVREADHRDHQAPRSGACRSRPNRWRRRWRPS